MLAVPAFFPEWTPNFSTLTGPKAQGADLSPVEGSSITTGPLRLKVSWGAAWDVVTTEQNTVSFSTLVLLGCRSLTNSLHSCWGHFLVTNGKDRFPICPLTNGLIKRILPTHPKGKPETSMGGDVSPTKKGSNHTLLVSRQVGKKRKGGKFPR